MKTLTPLLTLGIFLGGASAEAANCKKKVGNLCYFIGGAQRARIDQDQKFQRALEAMAEKLKKAGPVYIVQGTRTRAEQAALVRQHCKRGRKSCPGYASPNTSRHVTAIAADPWVPGQNIKPLCFAENQARVEFLGPRSAAAVYGSSKVRLNGKMQYVTGGHIDGSTGSNYTPRNCKRAEGLNGKMAQIQPGTNPDTGAPESKKVVKYKQKKAAAKSNARRGERQPGEMSWLKKFLQTLGFKPSKHYRRNTRT